MVAARGEEGPVFILFFSNFDEKLLLGKIITFYAFRPGFTLHEIPLPFGERKGGGVGKGKDKKGAAGFGQAGSDCPDTRCSSQRMMVWLTSGAMGCLSWRS